MPREKTAARHSFDEAWKAKDAGDLSSALTHIEEAIRLRPKSSKCWTSKGIFLRKLGRHTEARTAAEEAVALDPTYFRAWLLMGLTSMELGHYEVAAEAYERASQHTDDYNIRTRQAHAELHFNAHKARLHAQMALDLNPEWEEAKSILERAQRILSS